jgi:hypothetical protein
MLYQLHPDAQRPDVFHLDVRRPGNQHPEGKCTDMFRLVAICCGSCVRTYIALVRSIWIHGILASCVWMANALALLLRMYDALTCSVWMHGVLASCLWMANALALLLWIHGALASCV